MAVTGAPWQLECEKMEQRCGYLLTSGQWADCTFMVGSETNQTAVPAHKLLLAMSSPVFEAMFYGRLSEPNDPVVQIPDVQPEPFSALLQYIYTGNIDIGSFDMACDLWYVAKKYMLPHLVIKCNRYICSVLGPMNACRAYEFACLFDDKTLMDNCIKIISTNTKEVLNASSFVDVQLNTLIKVLSLDQLNVDSELDLFHAVTRYAEERQGQCSSSEDEGLSAELSEKILSLSVESQTSPAAELDSKPPTEVITDEPIIDNKNKKEEELTIREALQEIRFLSLSAAQFAKHAALSDLLTMDESFAVLMNILREDHRNLNNKMAICCKAGCLDHVIKALKCGIPSQVKAAAEAAKDILSEAPRIQQALDKGILDALGPALTEGDDECKEHAAHAIYNISCFGFPSQLRELGEAAALQPFCRLLAATDDSCESVLCGLDNLLENFEENTQLALLQKLREFGVPQLLITVQGDLDDKQNLELADGLLQTYFSSGQ